jgi:ATP-dependent RNA helicase DDX23/PRP28
MQALTSSIDSKTEPMSLEEFLIKKKQTNIKSSRPKFITKKERDKIRARQINVKNGGQNQSLNDFCDTTSTTKLQNCSNFISDVMTKNSNYNIKSHEENISYASSTITASVDDDEKKTTFETIKRQYLGGQKERKKIAHPSERMRFIFDWDAKEDTSRDLNPFYDRPAEVAFLFGRGLVAGIDRLEQQKINMQYEKSISEKLKGKTSTMTKINCENKKPISHEDNKYLKDPHWSEKKLDEMSERDWRIFREDFNISYKGACGELPLRFWDECPMPKEVRQAVEQLGYKIPTPIQRAVIPLGLQKRDVIGIAETGSGKTAAFVIPMLTYINGLPPLAMNEKLSAGGPYAIVMAPTRELAQQIEEETHKFARSTNYCAVSIVGGTNIDEQGYKLKLGCDIVIATPGRLIDCIERRFAVLNQCHYVVLDEADRMIDMGFEPQVQAILDAMPIDNLKPEKYDFGFGQGLDLSKIYRVTYMFSATMPPAVEKLARKYLRKPVVVTIGSAGKVTSNVTQRVIMCKENEKLRLLENELRRLVDKRTIVFANTQTAADSVQRRLEETGYKVSVFHGKKTQDQREDALKSFKEEKTNVLVATDVAGRGIDVPDVALVFNFEMANSIESYTHRIGRTGRAGKKGMAITLLTTNDSGGFYDLKKLLGDSKQPVPPELAKHEASKAPPGKFVDNRRVGDVKFAL